MKKIKVKKDLLPVQSLEDVDELLKEIAQMNVEIKVINALADEEINKIKEKVQEQDKEYVERIQLCTDSIAAYCQLNKSLLFKDGKKSLEMIYGVVGFRKSNKITTAKNTLELLKQLKYLDAIRTKESIKKDVMKNWDDEKLASVNAKKVGKDTFFCDIKEEKIAEIEQNNHKINS